MTSFLTLLDSLAYGSFVYLQCEFRLFFQNRPQEAFSIFHINVGFYIQVEISSLQGLFSFR